MHEIRFAAQVYQELKRRLKEEDPELDEITLADTIEGLTDIHDILAAIVRAALEDEVMVISLKARVQDMQQRLYRIEERSDIRRKIARDVMIETDIKKIVAPDFTMSIRAGNPSVVVIDETVITKDFWEPRPPKLNKLKLLSELKSGASVPGAVLANAELVLSVRVR